MPDHVAIPEISEQLDSLSRDLKEPIFDRILVAQFHPSPDYVPALIRIVDIHQDNIWYEEIIRILLDFSDECAIGSCLVFNFVFDRCQLYTRREHNWSEGCYFAGNFTNHLCLASSLSWTFFYVIWRIKRV